MEKLKQTVQNLTILEKIKINKLSYLQVQKPSKKFSRGRKVKSISIEPRNDTITSYSKKLCLKYEWLRIAGFEASSMKLSIQI